MFFPNVDEDSWNATEDETATIGETVTSDRLEDVDTPCPVDNCDDTDDTEAWSMLLLL